ncbi:MAG: PAS domain S-box protein, partial [Chloroflexi bacterium]|nr:PAS domain S-box protein [Chloroflexota bacterium]
MQEDETRQQLSDEVAALRQRVAELEGAESERQPAEEALRQSRDRERFLADVIENADQPVSVGYPDGRLGICNRAFCALTGYSAAELQSLDWSTVLTPPEWLESEMKALAELERTGRPVRYQKEYIRKDGRRVPIELLVHAVRDESGPVHLYYAFVTDITERVRAEQALKGYSQRLEEMVEERTQKLREREQWLSTTLRSIGDAVITTDAQGEVTLMNPVAEDLTGWDTAEAVGKPLEDVLNIINEQTGEPVESPVARVLREGVVVGLANHTLLIARDGTRRPIADSGAPMQDEAGHIVGTVMVFRDITARRRAEE